MSPESRMMNPGNARPFLNYSLSIFHYSLSVIHYSLLIIHYFIVLHLHRQSYTPRFRPCRHLRTYEDLRRHSRKFEDF